MKIKHIHTYQRVDHTGEWWKCTDGDCRHRDKRSFIIGKLSRCFKCGTTFTLSIEALRRKRPTCINCVGFNSKKLLEEAQNVQVNVTSLISNLFGKEGD